MRLALFIFAGVISLSCSPLGQKKLTRSLRDTEARFRDHTGVIVIDAERGKTVFEFQSDRYFTPASNTKILTLYASLKTLGDSVPALRFLETRDSLIFWGTGDPSLLYKEVYNNSRVLDFLGASGRPLYFSTSNFHTAHFGPGWAWDDYGDYYSAERSPLPVYGNCFSVYPLPDRFLVVPSFFERHASRADARPKATLLRAVHSNDFTYYPGRDGRFRSFTVPFKTTAEVTAQLLADTMHRAVTPVIRQMPSSARTLYSVPADSLYKVMMQQSDNMIAEHLLMMCAGVLSDTLQPEIAIRKIKQDYFRSFPDEPVWVDGSGLSRYNLFTPRFIAAVWQDLLKMIPRERLFPLLATGGKPGTLKNWYASPKPYVFGKTGTLSNNLSLSGYLITRKGKVLIFAMMNANYTATSAEVRTNMQNILNEFYEHY